MHEVAAASTLGAASRLLPADTSVGYLSIDWDGPQLYTETRLIYVSLDSLGERDDEVRENLARLGIRYLIWNRENSAPAQWLSAPLSGAFLRDHGRILAGDHNAYLIELLPQDGLSWGADHPQNLLTDSQFARIGRKGSPWDLDGRVENHERSLSIRAKSAVGQQVAVHGGHAYLLEATGECSQADDKASLGFDWADERGRSIGGATEMVVPGSSESARFLWRRASSDAASVVVKLGAAKGAACDFTSLALFDLGSP
jgi:hypothetical protein